jgi:hypothetical protein
MAFYKLENNEILLSGNWVEGPYYVLVEQDKDKLEYPVDGWYWFDTNEEAYTFLNYNPPEIPQLGR